MIRYLLASAAFVAQFMTHVDGFGSAGRAFQFRTFGGKLGLRGMEIVDQLLSGPISE